MVILHLLNKASTYGLAFGRFHNGDRRSRQGYECLPTPSEHCSTGQQNTYCMFGDCTWEEVTMRECCNKCHRHSEHGAGRGLKWNGRFNNGGGTWKGVWKDLRTLSTLRAHFLIIIHSNEQGAFREQQGILPGWLFKSSSPHAVPVPDPSEWQRTQYSVAEIQALLFPSPNMDQGLASGVGIMSARAQTGSCSIFNGKFLLQFVQL